MQAAMADDGTLLPYPEKRAEDPDAEFIAATNLFPYMSEYMQEESNDMSLTRLRSVDPGSPAHDAGIRPGETLT